MRRTLLPLCLAILLVGCSSGYTTPEPRTPTPVAKPPTTHPPRLLEQLIAAPGVPNVPVLNGTVSELVLYQKEFLTATFENQQGLRGIICYASPETPLAPAILARIGALYGSDMAKHCGDPRKHWELSEAGPRCPLAAGSIAHCHGNSVVCVITPKFYIGVMRHELFHAFGFANSTHKSKWRLKWAEDALYVGAVWRELTARTSFPRDGWVSAYAASDIEEDMAEVAEAAYLYMHRDEVGITDPYVGADLRDPRWRAKNKLLHEWSAISKEEFDQLEIRLAPTVVLKVLPAAAPQRPH